MKNIGRYEVAAALGRGGMGRVYKVRMPVTGKIVALKILDPAPPLAALLGAEELRKRFLKEAVTMARLRHPNVAGVWDVDDHQGRPFYIMEYYCNSLGAILAESYRDDRACRILPLDRACHYVGQILRGLACLHHHGIIHRDLTPHNVMVTDEDTAKITDLGMSKIGGERAFTPGNLIVGSPWYVAPEQERDPNQAGTESDLYSVGVMLYRMLTGRLPALDLPTSKALNPDLDDDWDRLCRRAVAQDPAKRFRSAVEMGRALDAVYQAWHRRTRELCELPSTPVEPHPAPKGPGTVRSQCLKLRPGEAREVFGVDALWRPRTYVRNAFRSGGDATVTDDATGLVWEQAGTGYPVTWEEAHGHVRGLNRERMAGYDRWRLPTVDELITLLSDVPHGGDFCIQGPFSREQRWLWSADRKSYTAAWYVNAEMGFVSSQDRSCYYYARGVCSLTA
jgi:serine/threonine-protein kinase